MEQSTEKPRALLHRREVLKRNALSNSGLYKRIQAGLFTRSVPLGMKRVGWPENEVDAIITARIAGQTDDEIRALVQQLHALRKAA